MSVTADEMMDRLKADRERYAALPWHRKMLEDGVWWIKHGIGNKYRAVKFAIRVRVNRAVRGYDECDWWEYHSTNSLRAAKLLTLLRDKGHGCPGNWGCDKCRGIGGEYTAWTCPCKPFDRWREALSDMIFFHETVAGDTIMQADLPDEKKHRYRRGKYYYFKYYESLWD